MRGSRAPTGYDPRMRTRSAVLGTLLATFTVLTLGLSLSSEAAPESPAERGKALYTAKCQACHGPAGKGDGPAAIALPQPPADFSAPAYWAKTDDATVKSIIKAGKPGTVMRGFPMPDADLDAVLVHLRSFAKK